MINTLLVDEVTNAFNEAVPLLHVQVKRKLGWRLSIVASTFALISALSFITAYAILKFKTEKDHDNLTYEEKEWNNFVESKKKLHFLQRFRTKDRMEKPNQVQEGENQRIKLGVTDNILLSRLWTGGGG